MPLGKYYCDYCDKEFQDTPVARKRHLQSSSHLRAKSLWYNSLKSQDLNRAYIDGGGGAFTKGVCNRFVKTGFCPYGDSCKYLHPTNSNNLQNNVNLFQGNQLVGGSSLPADVVRDSMGMPWGNLPPSLKPPPEGGYLPFPFVDWG
ncbi:zinc finger CCCH domain-containing protein 3 isoform X2 [Hevea brasiliensis]|uniref:zinc finger CCCH domain-containing protein 3 isoform X2 n=1 Tax=Hevea brasiliensis TaxID=3981 RepID=UPI0025E9D1CE|nr:zinc finger CCCH domain-containing protein 3 isoform X2 [Hevea brasiliensis]